MQSPITRLIFHPADDALLNYQMDDGHSVEPEWYIPVVPFVLINGAEGIGTGSFFFFSVIRVFLQSI